MHLSSFLTPILVGVSLALPGHPRHNSTIPSTFQASTLLPTGSGINEGGKPTSSIYNSKIHPTPTSHDSGSQSGGVSMSTVTQTITSTTFNPCSSPIGTQGGITYYSTWLTASIWEITTCYTTTGSAPIVTEGPTSPIRTKAAGAVETCPVQSTVTTTLTVTTGNKDNGEQSPGAVEARPVDGGSGQCERCETITHTNTYGHTTTIVILPFTNKPVSTEVVNNSSTSTYAAVTTTSRQLSGTAIHPMHIGGNASEYGPFGTDMSRGPRESKPWYMAGRFAK